MTTSDGVEELDLVVELVRTDTDSVSVRSVAEGQITDEGGGLYAREYTPSSLGAYALPVSFEKDRQKFVSSPTVFETSRAGEEGIQAEANGTTYGRL